MGAAAGLRSVIKAECWRPQHILSDTPRVCTVNGVKGCRVSPGDGSEMQGKGCLARWL